MAAHDAVHGALEACVSALVHRPSGLLTDIDGTISQIVDQPEEATVSASVQDALGRLARKLDYVGVLSGRMPGEMRRMLGNQPIDYCGLYGLALWRDGRTMYAESVQGQIPLMAQLAADLRGTLREPGIIIEEKGPILAIHYRQCDDPAEQYDHIRRQIEHLAAQHGLRVASGRKVLELRPAVSTSKGETLIGIVRAHDLQAMVYLGDDLADVEAMRVLRAWGCSPGHNGLAIGVQSAEMPTELASSVDILLRGVADVEQLLILLADRLLA